MRIRGWHIVGFGVHRDYRVDDLSGGLEVFYGPNEAGKSTLLAFLRGVLFGYPDGRSNEPKYAPSDGVAHGGRVTLSGAAGAGSQAAGASEAAGAGSQAAGALGSGDVVVERFAGRGKKPVITLEDGSAGDEAALHERLGRADAKLYRSVFAFGLRELQEVGALEEAGVQDQLFAAGSTGGGRPARETARELREQARNLFDGPKGRKKTDRARALVAEIGAVDVEITARQELAETYPALRDRLDALDAQLAELDERARSAREVEQRARRLVVLWNEVVSPLAAAREQLGKLAGAVPETLPADAGARLEAGLAAVAREEEALALLRREGETVAAQLDGLALDAAAHAVAPRVESLQAQRALAGSRSERLDALERDRDASAAQVRGVLERFFEDTGDAEASLRAVHRVPARREELRGWRSRLDEAARVQREHEAGLRVLERECEEAHARVTAAGEAERAAAPEPALRSEAVLGQSVPGAGAALAGAVVLLVASTVAAAGFFFVDRPELAVAVLLLGAGGLVVGWTRHRARAREAAAEALALVELRLEEERAGLEAAERSRAEAGEARRRLEGLEARRGVETGSLAKAREAAARLEVEFAQWKTDARVPEALGPEAAADFLEAALRGQSTLDERDRLEGELVRLRAEQAAFRSAVDDALAAGSPEDFTAPAGDPERMEAFDALQARCAADRAAREGRGPLEARVRDLAERLAQREASVAQEKAALAALLAEAELPDVPALQRALETAREAGLLETQVGRGEAELDRRLADVPPEEATFLRAELQRGSVAGWQEEAREAGARAATIGRERDEVLREHQDRSRDRTRLEASTELMDLELRKAELEEELREVLTRWRRLRVAAALVEEAVRSFEAAHQPGVLRSASRLFQDVTVGRYERVVQSEEGGSFAVLTADGVRRPPSELSQGTREQLYLCIRLGLVAEMARAGRALPVVMDDVLVNFDDERAAATAHALGQFAADHQVLFFTCSSRTRDLLAAAPNAALRSIG